MTTVLLIIHLFVTLALIGLVLIQRSEGGGLGIGNSQGMGAFMGGRGTANLLTRTTAILGAMFFALSLTLALMNRGTNATGHSLLDSPATSTTAPVAPLIPGANLPARPGELAPVAPLAPAAPAPDTTPAAPKAPAVPTN
jgi:preprotein translocase subunit SecG